MGKSLEARKWEREDKGKMSSNYALTKEARVKRKGIGFRVLEWGLR